MMPSRFTQAGRARAIFSRNGWPVPPAVLAVLVLLSAWSFAYELADTLLPAIGQALPFDGIAPDIAFATAGMLLVRRGFIGERGWALIGAGALCWAAGDIYWRLVLSALSNAPVPSWADAGYLSFDLFALAGIFLLVRRSATQAPGTLMADALAAALAAGALSAAVVLQPVLDGIKGGGLAAATNLAYPLSDVLLLGMITAAIALGSWRLNRMWMLLAASVLSFWIADSAYLVTSAAGTYQVNAWYNPLWILSPVLAAWAAWLPVRASAQVRQGTTSAVGIVMPLGFAVAALAILVWSSFDTAGVVAIALATSSLLVIIGRLALTWRENSRLLRATRGEAMTDALTGLGNRRALSIDLERRIATATAEREFALVLFDLDGFKGYNDNFGHPAGDALLQRLGRNLASHLDGRGAAYRMGGDEFCALMDAPALAPRAADEEAAAALSERGRGFTIGCSYGSVRLPREAQDPESALRIADQRMYAQKRGGRMSASSQSKDVLLRALLERDPDLRTHLRDVADLASAVAVTFSLPVEEVDEIRQAAELHDVGKVAIPDAILEKRAPLDDSEWAFIRRHTLIGERIIAAAPDLRHVATLVRSSHQNFDGSGYPDELEGDRIPLGSRIIAACDAFDAMTTERPYAHAMDTEAAIAELRRCAGRQFDPAVVEHLCSVLDLQRGDALSSPLHAVLSAA